MPGAIVTAHTESPEVFEAPGAEVCAVATAAAPRTTDVRRKAWMSVLIGFYLPTTIPVSVPVLVPVTVMLAVPVVMVMPGGA